MNGLRLAATAIELLIILLALAAFVTKHPILLGLACGIIVGKSITDIMILWRKR